VARLARDAAQRRSGRRRKPVPAAPFHGRVRNRLLHLRRSPEQIAARLRRMHPDDPTQRVSHETVHAAIPAQPRGGFKALMTEALRQAKPKRAARRASLAGSAMVPETLRIIYRPEDIEARLVPGHRQGDLIKGAFNRSAAGTVVERKTRFVILGKTRGCTASAALEGFSRQMKRLPTSPKQDAPRPGATPNRQRKKLAFAGHSIGPIVNFVKNEAARLLMHAFAAILPTPE